MTFTVKDIADAIEQAAPLDAQESYDNSGLLVGRPDARVGAALLCVDATEEVMDEAAELGADMVVSHHPVIFHPLKCLTGADHVQRVVERAVRNDIALYAAHTNLDAAHGGMSFRLASLLGVGGARFLGPAYGPAGQYGFGAVGELPEAVPAVDFMRRVMERLGPGALRHSDICRDKVQRIAVCAGSGSSLVGAAVAAGADMMVAADMKYNDFLDAAGRIVLVDAGHFETEYCAIDLLYDIITKKLPTFALHRSRRSRNPVNYSV